MKHWNGDWK